jgi:uncharacterized membrane protein YebE (DUF533 family)
MKKLTDEEREMLDKSLASKSAMAAGGLGALAGTDILLNHLVKKAKVDGKPIPKKFFEDKTIKGALKEPMLRNTLLAGTAIVGGYSAYKHYKNKKKYGNKDKDKK